MVRPAAFGIMSTTFSTAFLVSYSECSEQQISTAQKTQTQRYGKLVTILLAGVSWLMYSTLELIDVKVLRATALRELAVATL